MRQTIATLITINKQSNCKIWKNHTRLDRKTTQTSRTSTKSSDTKIDTGISSSRTIYRSRCLLNQRIKKRLEQMRKITKDKGEGNRIPKPKVTHKRPNHLMVRKPVDCPSTLVRATPHNLSILTNPRSTEKLASLLLESIPTRGDLELIRTKEIRRVISTKMRPVVWKIVPKAFNSNKQV